MGSHTEKQLLLPWTHYFCSISSIPNILTEESRPSKRHWCILRPAPLVFKLKYHRVYRNAVQAQNANSLLQPPPHARQAATPGKARESVRYQVLPNELSLWQRSGCNTGQTCWPSWVLKKKQWTWFLELSVLHLTFSPFFLLLKPTHSREKAKALCTVFCILWSAFHRGNHFEPIKWITIFVILAIWVSCFGTLP